MLKIVLDTNVVISAALSPTGNCAEIIDTIGDNEQIQLFYNEKILFEYKEVLSRKHLDIAGKIQNSIVESMKKVGLELAPASSDVLLPDESDRIFYDTALATGAILIPFRCKYKWSSNFPFISGVLLQLPANSLRFLSDSRRLP